MGANDELFSDHPESNFQRARTLVEQTLASLGLSVAGSAPPPRRKGGVTFRIAQEGAPLEVALEISESLLEEGVLRILARVAQIDDLEDERGLYRRLLEANAREIRGAAFGISQGEMVVVAERSVEDLDSAQVHGMLRVVREGASGLGRELAERYGAELLLADQPVSGAD